MVDYSFKSVMLTVLCRAGGAGLAIRRGALIATESSTQLRLLASIDPRLWDVLFPPQPPWTGRVAPKDPISQPWRVGSLTEPWGTESNDFQLQVQIAVRDLTRRIVDAAATASAQGGDGAALIRRTVDDWIRIDDGDGIGWVPLKLFFPPLWWIELPRPSRPDELVELVPAFAAAAWSFLVIAETIRDPSLHHAIHGAIDSILGRAERSFAEIGH
ncbi:hypothetical protein [Mycobacterium sp. BK086]|uniref:hypothetical protein n=1 Tax=Mycobacterium sp. BK086 TaxID=2512165 RepID=UPI002570ADE7|nr:hypothetical protein [Mycobacterium sp. BK086]